MAPARADDTCLASLKKVDRKQSALSRQPGDFAEVLQLQDSARRNRILAMLESPANDGIDLVAIHAKVVKSATASPLKSRIVRALQVVASKNGLRLE